MTTLKEKNKSLTLSPARWSRSDSAILSAATGQRHEPARRLIVLVPCFEADLTAIARRVWELANATGMHVQFLSLYSDPAQEPSIRRQLVTISAMVKDDRISTEADIIFGKDWVSAVRKHFRSGDTVVCFAEQYAGSSRKPLSEVLQSDLGASVYILSGLYPRHDSRSNWLAQIAVWTGSIAIILGFSLLQIKIDFAKDSAHAVLLLLSLPAEIWILWAWNSLFE